jgi:hypothetical protein
VVKVENSRTIEAEPEPSDEPPPFADMTERHHHFTVTVDGRHFSGDWQLQGREICIRSAYGSRTVPAGRSKPERVATKMLEQLVVEWKSQHH